MSSRRCLCDCHTPNGERKRADGVDVHDELESAIACTSCRASHWPFASATDNGEANPYLPPQQYSGEDGG